MDRLSQLRRMAYGGLDRSRPRSRLVLAGGGGDPRCDHTCDVDRLVMRASVLTEEDTWLFQYTDFGGCG